MSNPGILPDGTLDPEYNRRILANNAASVLSSRGLGPRPQQTTPQPHLYSHQYQNQHPQQQQQQQPYPHPYPQLPIPHQHHPQSYYNQPQPHQQQHPQQEPQLPPHSQQQQRQQLSPRPQQQQPHNTSQALTLQTHPYHQHHPQLAHASYSQPPSPVPPHDNTATRAAYQPPHSPFAHEPAAMSPFRPSGRKKALLVGINYRGTSAALRGCVRDVTFVHHLLVSKFGFRTKDFVILTDESTGISGVRKGPPTRRVIIDSLKWLVHDSRPGDSLWFSFSGHGSQVVDKNGDESDGYDETILPVDYKRAGHIVDDELYDIVRRLARGARLTVLLDACHSGTGLDLPYQHDVFGTGSGQRVSGGRPSLTSGLMGVAGAFFNGGSSSALQAGLNFATSYGRRKKRVQQGPDPNAGEVLLFAGCRDGETSADTNRLAGGLTTGAMTFALIEALEHSSVGDWRNYNYRKLLQTMRQKMIDARLRQVPQFSTSHPFDLSSHFIL